MEWLGALSYFSQPSDEITWFNEAHTKLNIGSKYGPNIVKIGAWIEGDDKNRYQSFLKDFGDMFSLAYGYMNSLDLSFLTHNLVVHEDVKQVQ